jgi:hypothetical protein
MKDDGFIDSLSDGALAALRKIHAYVHIKKFCGQGRKEAVTRSTGHVPVKDMYSYYVPVVRFKGHVFSLANISKNQWNVTSMYIVLVPDTCIRTANEQ